MSSTWSPQMRTIFITLVKERPCLYDMTCPEYKDGAKKKAGWLEIAKILGLGEADIDNIKEKWKSFRDCYKKYKNAHEISDCSEEAQKWKKWIWAPQLTFLDNGGVTTGRRNRLGRRVLDKTIPFKQPQKRTYRVTTLKQSKLKKCKLTPIRKSKLEEKAILFKPQQLGENIDIELAIKTEHDYEIEPNTSRHSTDSSFNALDDTRVDEDDEIIKYLNQLQETEDIGKLCEMAKLDKVDYLFLHYADTFKKLQPERQALLKLELAKLFADAELKDIEQKESSVAAFLQINSEETHGT